MAVRGLPSVPGYTLTRRIASGSSGEVYEAIAPGGFSKAIKVVPIDFSSTLSRRELEGVGLMRPIRHPHLVAIDRVDVRDDSIVIVMELADGSLRDEFRAARSAGLNGIPRRRLLGWLSEVAEALDFLSLKHNVRHLDVKPENCLLISSHLKISDFGLFREGAREFVNRKSQDGTPAYAAPEVFGGSVARTSHQYSLAVVYYEMLTGRRPFAGSYAAELVRNQSTETPDLRGLPTFDASLLSKALHPDPDRRFGSCTEFIGAMLENNFDDELGDACYAGPSSGNPRASTILQTPAELEDSWNDDASLSSASIDLDLHALTRSEKPSSRLVTHWTLRCEPHQACEFFERMASIRRAPVLDASPFRIVIALRGGKRSWRPLLGVRDPFLLIAEHLPRVQWKTGVHVVLTLEHYGGQLPARVFDQHARALMDEILKDVPMDRAEPTPFREDPRVAVERRVEVRFLHGPLRLVRIPCTAVDVSRRGIGLLSAAPLPLEPVVLDSRHLFRPAPAKIVRCDRLPDAPLYAVGLVAVDGVAPLEIFSAIEG